MATFKTTLRTNLLLLFLWLGVISVALLLWNLAGAVEDVLSLRAERHDARGMEAVIRVAYRLRQEDLATLRALTGTGPTLAPRAAADETDSAFAAALAAFDAGDRSVDARVRVMLDAVRDGLSAQRGRVEAALPSATGGNGTADAALRRWRAFMDGIYPQVEAVSHDLIRADGGRTRRMAAGSNLRHFGLFAFQAVITDRYRIEQAFRSAGDGLSPGGAAARALQESSAELRGATHMAEDQFLGEVAPAFARADAAVTYLTGPYLARKDQLLEAAVTGRPAGRIVTDWRHTSDEAAARLAVAETALASAAEARLRGAERQAMAALAYWTVALLVCIALTGFAVRFTLRWIVGPLERVHAKMLQLAHDDLTVDIVPRRRLAEIQVLYDALALFKENGLRRVRMQAELARLNDRMVTANRIMTADLEAAAKVQGARLPAPCNLPGVRFDSHYRPSGMISGDTYDYVRCADARTRFFQIDVSGHGPAAALVSVMSHIAVQSALQQAAPEDDLAAIVARINRDWDEALPYFTMVLVEIDPQAHEARIVQAGHPPVIRLPARGGVQSVGEGGLPVGALPWADYEVCTCPFHPGDRLVLATDGMTEAADHDGALFGDARYLDLLDRYGQADLATLFGRLDAALWDWCGTEAFDDDVTILILEAKEPAYAH